jgi:hypothetical protein
MTSAPAPLPLPDRETIPELAALNVEAFVTTRAAGDYALDEPEPRADNLARWHDLLRTLGPRVPRLVSARQVHGARVAEHAASWEGWLRVADADAHLLRAPGVAAAITVADCVPVFVAHPSGPVALVHAGWRGVASRVLAATLERMRELGLDPAELRVHFGPAICGRCYEVGPDVYERLTGWRTKRHRQVDLRALLAEQARDAGVRAMSASAHCTRCDNDRFFSHRAGDAKRQIAVVIWR